MTLVLNGTTGVSAVDGSASTPAIQGNDTNTGVFFPAADTVAVATGGSERVRVTSDGNVGVGTNSPANFGASFKSLQVDGSSYGLVQASSGTVIAEMMGSSASSLGFVGTRSNHAFVFRTNDTERARIDTSGNLLVGTTSFSGGSTVGFQINATNNTSGAYAQLIKNSSNTEIFQMRCNGGLANFSANDVNLSDVRVKTDIQDAGDYLAKICAIPVRTFKYKDQTDDLLNLGCIAQEVEVVAPELVDATGFGETPEDGIPLKAIYQTDLQYALMKCIQELNAKVESLTAEIATLKGAQA